MKFLHTSLNIAHSGCNPSNFMWLPKFSCAYPHISPLPTHLTPATTTFLQVNIPHTFTIQMSKPPEFAIPNHRHHTLNTQNTVQSTVRLLSFNYTPHIYNVCVIVILKLNFCLLFFKSLHNLTRKRAKVNRDLIDVDLVRGNWIDVWFSSHFNPFATADANMRQYFHCLQWYAGSEKVN